MTCLCRDEKGNLADRCYGNCVTAQERIRQQQENVSRDPLAGFAELILSQVDQRIENKMNKLRIDIEKRMMDIKVTFEHSQRELYKQAFLDGIKEGIELGKEISTFYN